MSLEVMARVKEMGTADDAAQRSRPGMRECHESETALCSLGHRLS